MNIWPRSPIKVKLQLHHKSVCLGTVVREKKWRVSRAIEQIDRTRHAARNCSRTKCVVRLDSFLPFTFSSFSVCPKWLRDVTNNCQEVLYEGLGSDSCPTLDKMGLFTKRHLDETRISHLLVSKPQLTTRATTLMSFRALHENSQEMLVSALAVFLGCRRPFLQTFARPCILESNWA